MTMDTLATLAAITLGLLVLFILVNRFTDR